MSRLGATVTVVWAILSPALCLLSEIDKYDSDNVGYWKPIYQPEQVPKGRLLKCARVTTVSYHPEFHPEFTERSRKDPFHEEVVEETDCEECNGLSQRARKRGLPVSIL